MLANTLLQNGLAKYSFMSQVFIGTLASLSTFFLILELFKHIFEHINCPLSGLIFITDKCRPEDKQGVLLGVANGTALYQSHDFSLQPFLFNLKVMHYIVLAKWIKQNVKIFYLNFKIDLKKYY